MGFLDDLNYRLSEPFLELTQRLMGELRDLEYNQAIIKVLTTNPDGTRIKEIKYGFTLEVIAYLEEKYGGQMSEKDYHKIGGAYTEAVEEINLRSGILPAIIWEEVPEDIQKDIPE